jgi:cytochrome oxidase assembly protein ShyY1
MSRPAFIWQIHWPTTLFVFALLPCLLALGVWQWHRADEKRLVQQQYAELQQRAPVDAALLPNPPANYTRVMLQGHYDNSRNWLLDNRVLNGRVGFEVLTPFVSVHGSVVLVNRGWIIGDPARRVLPAIPSIDGQVTLSGHVYRPEIKAQIGGEQTAAWPRVIEQIDFAQIDNMLPPWTLRLDATATGALQPEWPVVTGSPEKHVAYAVQWFAMAMVLLLMWVLRSSNVRAWLGGSNEPDSNSL